MMRRRGFIIVLLCMVLLLTSVSGYAGESTDKPSKWAEEAVKKAIERGRVPERLQSNYQAPITREEFADLLVTTIFAHLEEEAYSFSMNGKPFPYWTKEMFLERVTLDFEFEDAKQEHVKIAYLLGSINGVSDTRFEPDKHITRQEAAVMLMNTIHAENPLVYAYVSDKDLGYSDYEQIAEWAKPAVRLVTNLHIMAGTGKKFDYAGKFTREQAISIMADFVSSTSNHYGNPHLKGNIRIPPDKGLVYNVGKDYVKVNYVLDESDPEFPYRRPLWLIRINQHWNDASYNRGMSFTSEKGIIIFYFLQIIKADKVNQELFDHLVKDESVSVDYGYMVLTTRTDDALMEFKMKPVKGYMSIVNGYWYDYPRKPVEPKIIK